MTNLNLRTLCTALGFTAVVLRGDASRGDSATRARDLAKLIETFCRSNTVASPRTLNKHDIQSLIEELTPRETEVLKLVAEGKNSAGISDALDVSEETVKAHIKNFCRKLQATNKAHATAIAFRRGLFAEYPPNGG